MKEAYEIVLTKKRKVSHKEKERGKALYNMKVHGVELLPGNRVLVRNFKERRWARKAQTLLGRKGLCCHFEEAPG